MSERVITTDSLQMYLAPLIPTRRVRVKKTGGVIVIEPLEDGAYRGPLRGIASDSGLTVDKFLESKHKDKELECEQDLRL